MTIIVYCKGCSTPIGVRDEMAGAWTRCPICNALVIVPADASPLDTRQSSAESIAAAMAELRALDPKTATVDGVASLVDRVLDGCRIRGMTLPAGQILRRARVCPKPTHIRALLYPPAEKTPLGRANRAGCPVLYCCTSGRAAVFECRPREGEIVALARWKTTADITANHVGYTQGVFDRLGSSRDNSQWGPSTAGHVTPVVAEFLAELFTKVVSHDAAYEYVLSAAISERLFSQNIFGALVYPSIAMNAKADNLAIKCKHADNHLEFLNVELHRIDRAGASEIAFTRLDSATKLADDGTILWSGRPLQWVIRELGAEVTFTAGDGEWVGRDQNGRIVDPE